MIAGKAGKGVDVGVEVGVGGTGKVGDGMEGCLFLRSGKGEPDQPATSL